MVRTLWWRFPLMNTSASSSSAASSTQLSTSSQGLRQLLHQVYTRFLKTPRLLIPTPAGLPEKRLLCRTRSETVDRLGGSLVREFLSCSTHVLNQTLPGSWISQRLSDVFLVESHGRRTAGFWNRAVVYSTSSFSFAKQRWGSFDYRNVGERSLTSGYCKSSIPA